MLYFFPLRNTNISDGFTRIPEWSASPVGWEPSV